MMRDKIRSLSIRFTELSEYMKISRPTFYKYVDSYESGDRSSIPGDALKLFDLIDSPSTTNKEQVLSYIMGNRCLADEGSARGRIQRFADNVSEDDSKMEFIDRLIGSAEMDAIIPYLSECLRILDSDSIDAMEATQISKFITFRENVIRFMPSTPEDMELTKKILGERYR